MKVCVEIVLKNLFFNAGKVGIKVNMHIHLWIYIYLLNINWKFTGNFRLEISAEMHKWNSNSFLFLGYFRSSILFFILTFDDCVVDRNMIRNK